MIWKLKLITRILYKEEPNGILYFCIEPFEQSFYLTHAHQSSTIHYVGKQTIQSLLQLDVYWPSMQQDAHTFVQILRQYIPSSMSLDSESK